MMKDGVEVGDFVEYYPEGLEKSTTVFFCELVALLPAHTKKCVLRLQPLKGYSKLLL